MPKQQKTGRSRAECRHGAFEKDFDRRRHRDGRNISRPALVQLALHQDSAARLVCRSHGHLRRVPGLLCLRNDPGSQLQKERLVLRALHRNGLLSHLSGRRTAERAVRLHRHGRNQAGMLHPCGLLRRVSWHSSGRTKAHPPPGLTKKLRIDAELFSYIAAKPHIMFYHRSKRGTSYVDVSTSRQHSHAAGEKTSGPRALFGGPTAAFLRAFPNPERRCTASPECVRPRAAHHRRSAEREAA